MIRRVLHGSLATETAWSLAHEAIALVTMLASFLLLARHLGTEMYGSYVGLYGLLAPFTAFTLSGVSLTVLEHTVREREDADVVVRSCTAVAVLLGGLLSAVVVGLAALVIGGIDVLTMVLLVTAELIVNSSTFALTASIQARFGFVAAARVRIAGHAVRLTALLALSLLDTMTLTHFAVVYFASFAGYALWVSWLARRRGYNRQRFGRVDRRHAKSTFLYGFGISAVNAQNDGDKVALNAFDLKHDAGVYGAAYRVVQMGLLPITALVTATHVSFLHVDELANDQLGRAKRLAAVSFVYAGLFVVGLLVAAPLLPRILGDSFSESSHVMPWLAPLVVLRGPGTFAMNGLLGLGRNRLRTTILVSNAFFSIILYVTLIPAYEWRGAAAATVTSELTMFLAGWIALARCQHADDARTGRLTRANLGAQLRESA